MQHRWRDPRERTERRKYPEAVFIAIRHAAPVMKRGLAVERDHGVAALSVAIDGRAIDDQGRESAAIIAINKVDATAQRFDVALFFMGGDVGRRASPFPVLHSSDLRC